MDHGHTHAIVDTNGIYYSFYLKKKWNIEFNRNWVQKQCDNSHIGNCFVKFKFQNSLTSYQFVLFILFFNNKPVQDTITVKTQFKKTPFFRIFFFKKYRATTIQEITDQIRQYLPSILFVKHLCFCPFKLNLKNKFSFLIWIKSQLKFCTIFTIVGRRLKT